MAKLQKKRITKEALIAFNAQLLEDYDAIMANRKQKIVETSKPFSGELFNSSEIEIGLLKFEQKKEADMRKALDMFYVQLIKECVGQYVSKRRLKMFEKSKALWNEIHPYFRGNKEATSENQSFINDSIVGASHNKLITEKSIIEDQQMIIPDSIIEQKNGNCALLTNITEPQVLQSNNIDVTVENEDGNSPSVTNSTPEPQVRQNDDIDVITENTDGNSLSVTNNSPEPQVLQSDTTECAKEIKEFCSTYRKRKVNKTLAHQRAILRMKHFARKNKIEMDILKVKLETQEKLKLAADTEESTNKLIYEKAKLELEDMKRRLGIRD